MRVPRFTLAAIMALSAPLPAEARVEAQSGYSKQQTYNAALRYLRVDCGYEVVERDADAGYLLFRYAPPGRTTATNGSIEIVEAQQTVRIYVQLPQMPEYHERVLSDGLRKKLHDEYGEPGPRAPEEKPADPPRGKKRDGSEGPSEPKPAPKENAVPGPGKPE